MFATSKTPACFALLALLVLIALPAVAQQGRVLGVTKVLPDDVLYVRASPGASAAIVGALPFDATGITATGEMKVDGRTTWLEVSYAGFTGWASRTYLDQVASSRNVTEEWVKRLGSAASPDALARKLAGALNEMVASEGEGEMEGGGSAVLVGVTKSGPPRAVVYVRGYMDDSVSGEQFVLTMREDGGSYVVDTVRASVICARGVAGSLCL